MRALLENIASPIFAMGALAFFGVSFLAILLWTFKLQSRVLQKKIAELPFEDDQGVLK